MPKQKIQNGFTFSSPYMLTRPLPAPAYSVIEMAMEMLLLFRLRHLLMDSHLTAESEKEQRFMDNLIIISTIEGMAISLHFMSPLYNPLQEKENDYTLWIKSFWLQAENYYYHVIDGGYPQVTGFTGNTRRKVNRDMRRELLIQKFSHLFEEAMPMLEMLHKNEERVSY